MRHRSAYGVANLLKLARPVVGTGTGLHADEAWVGGARSSSSLARGTLGRAIEGWPVVSTPRTANTFLASSTPIVTMPMDLPFQQTSAMTIDRNPHRGAVLPYSENVRIIRGGEVPFIH